MRAIGFILGALAFAGTLRAQVEPVAKFQGDSPTTTETFTVTDNWEVVWNSPAPVRISLLSPDGKLVAGVAGMFRGSLYQAKGGTFYLQVSAVNPGVMPHWEASIQEAGTGGGDNGGGVMHYVAPQIQPPAAASSNTAASDATSAPGSAAAPPPPAATPKSALTDDQAAAVVTIQGDNSEGTGFLVKTPDGPAVVTNLHVVAANPHLRILTTTGAEVAVTGMKGATDRDLALLTIKDSHYSYLDLNQNISTTVHVGDEVITPGNSEGGGVLLNTHGNVVALGPDRIEFNNPIYHGNSGGPVFHVKSGKVLGVVTQALKVDTSNELDKASYSSRNSAITGAMRYFGLRLDTVPKWEVYSPGQFQIETNFLREFHAQSRRLDSYLNSSEKTDANASSSEDDDSGRPNSKLYLHDARIVKAHDDFFQQARGGDAAERLDAARTWLFNLDGVADTNVSQMQNPENFYQFDRQRVREELAYRAALKKELDSYGDDISRIQSLGHRN